MPSDHQRYSLTELANLAGVSVRTVRYYQSQGLLSSSGTSGPGAKYGETHLARLLLIRRLQREHLPLAEIRRQLDEIDDATIATLAEGEPPEPPVDSALEYVRRVLEPGGDSPSPLRRSTNTVAESDVSYALAAPALSEPSTPESPKRLVRSQWERIPLATDVELHVRRPLPRPLAKQVDRLIAIAADLLKEDPS